MDLKLINSEKVTVYRGDQENPILKEFVVHQSKYRTNLLKRMCAKKLKCGAKMGKYFIEPFKEAIERFLRERNDEKEKTLSAERMQEILILHNPMRYDIPLVHQITSFVKSFLQKMNNNGEIRISTADVPQTTQRRLLAAKGGNYYTLYINDKRCWCQWWEVREGRRRYSP